MIFVVLMAASRIMHSKASTRVGAYFRPLLKVNFTVSSIDALLVG
jgi:hypothetical protein